ncbi:MAG: beta-galactosidase [Lachnospiraceae bacterium]
MILATPSGASEWLAGKYPRWVDEPSDLFGGRHNHCYTVSGYREGGADQSEAVGTAGQSSGVILWHISNEWR